MRVTLPEEVVVFLRSHGPATASECALEVQARRDDVDEVLATDARVMRAPRPEGGSARAAYFNASEHVLQAQGGNVETSDNVFLLGVLKDGRWHTLTEILSRSFADRGVGLTVHSRAADLRRDLRAEGRTIENRTRRGPSRRCVSEYRLVAITAELEAA